MDGQIAQCVDDTNIAWHAGSWHAHRHSIGIEHEGYLDDPAWFTTPMYRSSARLVAYLCGWYGIPIDRWHIIGIIRSPRQSAAIPGGITT